MVYPNPTNNDLNIKLDDNLNFIRCEIFNILGQSIMKTENKSFSVKHLPEATYFIKVYTEKGQGVRKFVKK